MTHSWHDGTRAGDSQLTKTFSYISNGNPRNRPSQAYGAEIAVVSMAVESATEILHIPCSLASVFHWKIKNSCCNQIPVWYDAVSQYLHWLQRTSTCNSRDPEQKQEAALRSQALQSPRKHRPRTKILFFGLINKCDFIQIFTDFSPYIFRIRAWCLLAHFLTSQFSLHGNILGYELCYIMHCV